MSTAGTAPQPIKRWRGAAMDTALQACFSYPPLSTLGLPEGVTIWHMDLMVRNPDAVAWPTRRARDWANFFLRTFWHMFDRLHARDVEAGRHWPLPTAAVLEARFSAETERVTHASVSLTAANGRVVQVHAPPRPKIPGA